MKPIPHSRPSLGVAEAEAAARAVASGWIAEGPEVAALEREFAARLGVAHAVAFSSGTAALTAILAALGVGAGDEVIVPDFACAALLHAVRPLGARAVPADIEPASLLLDPADVARRLTPRTRAVVVAHLFGRPARMAPLLHPGVALIEDCAQSLGAEPFRSEPPGASGPAAFYSFHATKMIAAGTGGMAVTQSAAFASRLREIKAYDQREEAGWRFNFRLSDLQAAVARVQLGRLDAFVARRREIARRFREAFRGLGAKLPEEDPAHVYYRFVIDLGRASGPFLRRAQQAGVGCARPVFAPLHRLTGDPPLAASATAWRQSASIPLYPALSEEEIDRVIAVVRALLASPAAGEEGGDPFIF